MAHLSWNDLESRFRALQTSLGPTHGWFLLDYQWADVNRLNAAGANIGEDVNVVSFRTQYAF